MNRLPCFCTSVLLACTAAFLLSLNGCSSTSSSGSSSTGSGGGTPPPSGNIQHVVVIFQENRTPDNLFYGLCIAPYGSPSACSTTPSATQYNIQTNNWLNNTSTTGVTQPSQIELDNDYDISHAHSAFLDMCDMNTSTNVCAMDGAALIPTSCATGATNCPPANAQFMYVDPANVAAYLQMAQTYTFADEMFQTNEGPSFPAHQFILSGTSAPAVGSTYFVAENATGTKGSGSDTGCTAPNPEFVDEINSTDAPGSDIEIPIFPCFEHQTLTDLLDAANLSWRYYSPSAGSLWNAPNAINHMCQPTLPLGSTSNTCGGPDWTGSSPKVVLNQSQSNAQVISDIQSGNLQTVSWVIPDGQDSDHALSNNGCGPSWVTSIVNAIGNSQYWSNTVIIITWDDWGGWYDHVAPQIINSYEYGFRVPMLVISPYVKKGYISHVTHDFGSILKFIETTFNLPSLNYADANADDLSDLFNNSQSAAAFQVITTPADTGTCQADPSEPADPDDD
jgi:phospholipase C